MYARIDIRDSFRWWVKLFQMVSTRNRGKSPTLMLFLACTLLKVFIILDHHWCASIRAYSAILLLKSSWKSIFSFYDIEDFRNVAFHDWDGPRRGDPNVESDQGLWKLSKAYLLKIASKLVIYLYFE